MVNLYAGHLGQNPDGLDVTSTYLDRLGYYTETRRDGEQALFQSQRGLKFQPNFTYNLAEFNTISCPWHHNLTAALCSFRAAKALRRNPGSRHAIPSFRWSGSEQFKWQSQQLMDLGFMEPGQWF